MKRLINFFVFVDRAFAATVDFMLIVMLLSMVGLIASQVLLRNLFGGGIQWADVAARHMVLWVALLGAMLATRSRQHVAIDVLTRFIPRTPRNVIRIVIDAFASVVAFLLARTALYFVLGERAMGGTLFANVPAWAVETIIPFGFAMISLEYAIGIGLDIWRIAQGDAGHVAGRGRA
ncbi:MAG: TRAP transporter small permease [Pseudomonadota bacterium]